MNLSKIFEQVVLVSIMSSVLAIEILLIKGVFRQKLSGKLHYYLWFLLLIRLFFPFSLESSLSLFNFIPNQQVKIDITSLAQESSLSIPLLNTSQYDNQETPLHEAIDSTSTAITKGLGFNFKTATLIWLIGVLSIFLYTITVNIALLFKQRKQPLCDKLDINDLLEKAKISLKVRRKVSIVYDSAFKSPAIYGLIRPKLLISKEIMDKLTTDELKFIILHEVTHLKRRDLHLNIIIMFIQVIYWFNPIIWYSLYKFKQDCELACDETVLETLTSVEIKKYGHTIIKMLQILSKPYWVPGTLGFASKYNNRRILMISSLKKSSMKAAVLALSLTLLVGCSSLTSPVTINPTNTTDESSEVLVPPTAPPENSTSDGSGSSNSSSSNNNNNTTLPGNPNNNTGTSSEENSKQELLLSNIKKLAQEGKIINCEFPVKTIVIDTVEEKWGKPDQSDWVSEAKGLYVTFSKYNVVFGVNKGSQIFEVRSFDKSLGEISLSMVKKAYGAPEYDVTVNGEEIIGYTAGKDYKILLVFPQPTVDNKDPLLHHYSVFYPRGTVNNMSNDPGREW